MYFVNKIINLLCKNLPDLEIKLYTDQNEDPDLLKKRSMKQYNTFTLTRSPE